MTFLSSNMKEQIRKVVINMDGNERAKLQAERDMLADKLKQVEEQAKKKPVLYDLDEDDNLRLENILLKERLFENERQAARNAFYARLVKKYNIDSEKSDITVDAQARKLVIVNK